MVRKGIAVALLRVGRKSIVLSKPMVHWTIPRTSACK